MIYTIINRSSGVKEQLNSNELQNRIKRTKNFGLKYKYIINKKFDFLSFFGWGFVFVGCSLFMGVLFLEMLTKLI
tara:strand:- start:432 stop:656 length:225 start_codon:yes stop_codon:yes gene_type:complete